MVFSSRDSRRKWIIDNEKFNNFQTLFKNSEEDIREMFTYLIEKSGINEGEVRIYGEIFGGKYGQETDFLGAIKTQNEPNYGPNNDFAFFDIFIRDLQE